MNIVTPVPTAIPFTTSNVNTESARRDNVQREVIPQPTQPENSASEKGLGSESDRLKQSAQNSQSPVYERPVVQQNQDPASQQGLNGETPDNAQQESAGKENAEERQKQEQQNLEKREVDQLKARDREVRAHEQAHAAVGGQYAGSPSYDFETGPDGQQYAVGGEVSIDIAKEAEPEDTLAKMQQVRAAALAPAEPSPQDFRVASEASRIAGEARAELSQETLEKQGAQQADTVNQLFGEEDGPANSNDAIEESVPELDEIVENNNVSPPTRSLEQESVSVASVFDQNPAGLTANPIQEDSDTEFSANSRSEDINQRALRISNFYQQVSQPQNEGFQQFA